jgi:hypothetical protein
MMPSKRRALDKDTPMGAILEKIEKAKATRVRQFKAPNRPAAQWNQGLGGDFGGKL